MDSLFADHMRHFRNKFNVVALEFGVGLKAQIEAHLDVICGTLDILRSENVASESEQDTEFRNRVEASVAATKENMRQILTTVGLQ